MSRRINVRDERWGGDFEKAFRESGGSVFYLPYEDNKPWWIPKPGWRITRPCEIYGDGKAEDVGLRFFMDENGFTGDSNGLILEENTIWLHDLTLSNARGPQIGTGSGIIYRGVPDKSERQDVIGDVWMDRLYVYYSGAHGFISVPPYNPDRPGGGFLVTTNIRNCNFSYSGANGVRVDRASTTLHFDMIWCDNCGKQGFWMRGSINGRMDNVIAEGCGRLIDAGDPQAAALYLEDCHGFKVKHYAEQFANLGPTRDALLMVNCDDNMIEPGASYNWEGPTNLCAVRMRNCDRNEIGPQVIAGDVTNAVIGDSSCTNNVVSKQAGKISLSSKRNVILGSQR